MKNFWLVWLLCALCCAPAISQEQTEPAPPPAQTAADAFVWRFAPPVGSRWTMRSFTRTVTVTETPSIKVEFNSETAGASGQSGRRPGKPFVDKTTRIERLTADYDVLSRDTLGATTIRLTYRALADDLTTESLSMGFKQSSARVTKPRFIDGATLTFKRAPDGKIWNVLGGRAFQRRLLQASGSWDASQIEAVLDRMRSDDDASLVAVAIPWGAPASAPVRVGESWAYQAELSASLPRPLRLGGTRTLKALTPDSAVITDSAMVDGSRLKDQIPVVPNQGEMQFRYDDVIGSINATSRVARASGLPLETLINQKFGGVISTPLSDGEGNIVFVSRVRADIGSSTRVVLEPRK